MKTFILSFSTLALIGCATSPSKQSQPSTESKAETQETYTGAKVRRWSPVVSDLDETIYLYTEILGFELGRVFEDPKDSYVFQIFDIDPALTTRHALFHAGEDKRVLTAVEVPGLSPDRLSETPHRSVTLINANGNFDEIKAKLEDGGYETMIPHKLGPQGIEMGFVDKDGHVYAVYEVPYTGDYKFGD